MERFMSLVKRYPLPIAGAVLAVVLIVWYLSGNEETGDSVSRITSFGPDPTSVMANRDVNIAEKQMNAAAAANAAALEGMKIQGDYSVQLAGIDAINYERTLNTTRDITEIQAARDVDIVKATGATQQGLATIVTGAQTAQTQIVTGAKTAQTQIVTGAQTAQTQIITGAQTAQTQIVTGAQTAQTQIVTGAQTAQTQIITGAAVQQSQISANAATSLAKISADLQRSRDAAAAEIARADAAARESAARYAADASISTARINAEAAANDLQQRQYIASQWGALGYTDVAQSLLNPAPFYN